jgi:ABC transporter ATM
VAESGTHEKLIDRGGLYSELWSAQETLFVDDVKEAQVEEKK